MRRLFSLLVALALVAGYIIYVAAPVVRAGSGATAAHLQALGE